MGQKAQIGITAPAKKANLADKRENRDMVEWDMVERQNIQETQSR